MSIVLIALVAVFFAAMGIFGLLRPSQLVEPFGLLADRPDARAEVRAVYGGFGIAIAAIPGLAVVDVGNLRFGACVAVAVGGMAFGRVWSAVMEALSAFFPIWFLPDPRAGHGRTSDTGRAARLKPGRQCFLR